MTDGRCVCLAPFAADRPTRPPVKPFVAGRPSVAGEPARKSTRHEPHRALCDLWAPLVRSNTSQHRPLGARMPTSRRPLGAALAAAALLATSTAWGTPAADAVSGTEVRASQPTAARKPMPNVWWYDAMNLAEVHEIATGEGVKVAVIDGYWTRPSRTCAAPGSARATAAVASPCPTWAVRSPATAPR